MELTFNPRDLIRYSNALLERSGRKFDFKFAFEVEGVKFYEPVDINFPSSIPVSEKDLIK